MRKLILLALLVSTPVYTKSGVEVLPKLSRDKVGSMRTITALDPVEPASVSVGPLNSAGSTVRTVAGLDVREYKRAGDTDDTASFQRAINAAQTGSVRTVVVPPGTYNVASALTLSSSYVSLVGSDSGTTTLQFAGTSGDILKVMASRSSPDRINQVAIRHLKIQCTRAVRSGWQINTEAVNGLTIEDVALGGCFSGIRVAGVYNAMLRRVNAKWPANNAAGRIGLSIEPATKLYGSTVSANIHLSDSEFNSVWNPGNGNSTTSPGLQIALHVTGIDGLFATNNYFGSCAGSCVLLDNSSGAYVTGVIMSNSWIDHGTGLALETTGTTADNFGDFQFDNLRIFGSLYSPGLIRLGGNPKRITFNGGSFTATNGDMTTVALTGNGEQVQFNGITEDYVNQVPAANSALLRIASGMNVSINGGTFNGRGYGVYGIYVGTGYGVSVSADRITGCLTPVVLDTGASTSLVRTGNFAGCTSSSPVDRGTNDVITGRSPSP